MRINLKIIAVTLAVSMLAMSSCKDDNDPELVPAEEAEATMLTTGNDMETTMQQVMITPGVSALMNLMALTGFELEMKSSIAPFASTIEILKQKGQPSGSALMESISKMVSSTSDVDPLMGKGTYSWDFVNSTWVYSNTPEDMLIYNFPSNIQQTENNAILTVSEYSRIESGEKYFPTSIKITLVVDDVPVLDIDYSVTLSDLSVNSIDVNVSVTPFEFGANLTVTEGSSFVKVNGSASIVKQNVTIASTSMEMQFDDMTSLDPFIIDKDLEPTTAKGYMQMGEIKAQLDMAMAVYSDAIEGISDKVKIETAANANLLVAFYTYPGGLKLGDVVWKWDTAEMELVAYFKFNNGVEKPLEEVLDLEENFFDI